MKSSRASLIVAFLGLAALAKELAAQTPLGGDLSFLALPPNDLAESEPLPVCDKAGVCALFWLVSYRPGFGPPDIFGVTISPEGQVLAGPKRLASAIPGYVAAGLDRGFVLVSNHLSSPLQLFPALREFDEFLHPARPPVALPSLYTDFVAVAHVGSEYVLLAGPLSSSGKSQVALYFLDHAGSAVRPPSVVNEDPTTAANVGRFTLQPNGDLVVVYWRGNGLPPSDVYFRRVAADGTPLGPESLVNTERNTVQGGPVVAAGPDGSFMVAWQRAPNVGTTGSILARRFAADGTPIGEPFQANDRLYLDQRYPKVTADAEGNYFITWQAFVGNAPGVLWDIEGRLFRHDGTPVTHQIRLNQDRRFEQEAPRVAFAPNGIVVAGWHSQSPRQGGPVVRRFAASPGLEICATWGPHLRCDLARTGGTMELQLEVPSDFGEVPLLGDVDGDGRDDVCSYLNGKLHCDPSHQNVPPGWTERFGASEDLPLLGDVDGDGKADPCVRRKSFLVCDTRHDGTESYRLQLGRGGETPLLGDLDGDGRADLCLVEGRFWSCRLSSTGEPLKLTFGRPGDSPALGDVNRDGKADPCLLRKGLLSCNTKHDGGAADYNLQLDVPAGARLLFGNLDGL